MREIPALTTGKSDIVLSQQGNSAFLSLLLSILRAYFLFFCGNHPSLPPMPFFALFVEHIFNFEIIL